MNTAHQAALEGDPQEERSRISLIDAHVGSRIRLRRRLMGMSQDQLGRSLGVSFQQVQKYELGANRVGASRIFDISCLLDVPIGFFFDAMPDRLSDRQNEFPHIQPADPETPAFAWHAPSHHSSSARTSAELMRFYDGIADPLARLRIFELIKSMSAAT